MSNILAIVGRPNVGKSTFFNRVTGMRKAIVDSVSGITRDRHYGKSDWNGVEFSVIDTGGYIIGSDDIFEEEIRKQVDLAIDEADVILFMVDAKEGVSAFDEDVADILRKTPKKVLLAVNKVDNPRLQNDAVEFYSLGLGEIYCISSVSGSGTGELLDAVVESFNVDDKVDDKEYEDLPHFAVVGRPNVGKSSFINTLLGYKRNIVTDIAGTTRDSINSEYNAFGFNFLLVDTAGIRKKTKVSENIEFYSVMRSIRAIEHSDICFLIVDATNGFESQDLNIFHLIVKNNKGVVIIVNKWDLIAKETNTANAFIKKIKDKIAPFNDVPIVFTSIINKQRIFKALEVANSVYKRRSQIIATSVLNEELLPVFLETPPPAYKGKYIKIKYVTQLKLAYPAFVIFCNLPQYIRDPYRRFVENRLREKFDFEGVPIQIYFRQK